MFGTYRTILALAVVFQHLAGIPLVGHFAVHAFFILSGYLMTSIMHRTYGYTLSGFFAYWGNRFLRLYPSYWLMCLIALAAIAYYGHEVTTAYHPGIYTPTNTSEILSNISLVFPGASPKFSYPRLCPPTWALTLELAFYLLIGLGASRNKRLTLMWLFVSFTYIVFTFLMGWEHESRYSYVPAASLPFCVGALLFHYRPAVRRLAKAIPLNPLYVFLSYPFLAVGSVWAGGVAVDIAFYLNVLMQAFIIVRLADVKTAPKIRSLDKRVGELSYPVYLIHYSIGLMVAMTLWGEPLRGRGGKEFLTACVAAILTLAVSYIINWGLDHNIERLRTRIKKRHKSRQQEALI